MLLMVKVMSKAFSKEVSSLGLKIDTVTFQNGTYVVGFAVCLVSVSGPSSFW